jgi:maltose alpha-D-glucosyltransferase / alpha-amylase
VVEVELDDRSRDRYVVPLAFVHGRALRELGSDLAPSAVLRLDVRSDRAPHDVRSGVLVDALACHAFRTELLATFRDGASARDDTSEVRFHRVRPLSADVEGGRQLGREQTNTSIVYGNRFVAKVLRKLDSGESPDVEMGRFLTNAGFSHAPALHGFASVILGNEPPATLAVLHELVPNKGDAWEHTLRELTRFLDDARALPHLVVEALE